MILRFSDEFLPYTNGLPELTVTGSNVGECLNHTFELYPQLYVYLMDGEARVAQQSIFKLNDEYIYEFEDCEREVAEGDVLVLTQEVPTGEGGMMKFIPGVLMIVAGAIAMALGQPWGLKLIIAGAISIVSAGIADMMAPTLRMPDAGGGLDGSNAYTFNGIQNTTASGTPLQIVYGTFRVGGQYLNIYTTSSFSKTPDSSGNKTIEQVEDWLHAQIGLCEGYIQQVSDVHINKLPTNYYNAIDFVDNAGVLKPANVNLGTGVQFSMEGFNRTSNTVTVSRKIINPTNADGTLAPTIINAADTTYEDFPVYGYRDKNGTVHYGACKRVETQWNGLKPPEVYYVGADANDPEAELRLIPWEWRDKKVEAINNHVNVGGYLYQRRYSSAKTKNFNAANYTRIKTSKKVNAFTLTLTLPGGLYTVGNGGYEKATVSIIILYRALNTSGWTVYQSGASVPTIAQTISEKQRGEIVRTYEVTGLPYEEYDIAVLRDTPEHEGWFDLVDDIYIKSITEYQDGELAYPHTAMIGVHIRATEQLSQDLPSITSLVKGTRIALPMGSDGVPITEKLTGSVTWTGKLSCDEEHPVPWGGGQVYWSDNPVWCLYDLLTNKRYGLGDYYKIDPAKLPIMQAKFFIMGQYCDERIPFKDEFGVTGPPRKRFTLNMVIDQSKSASEWIAEIVGVMRGICFYTEGIFWLEIDRPKYTTQIFNMSNIKDYSQSGTSYRNIPNCYEVQYPSWRTNYEIDSFRIESKDLQLNQHIEERKKALTFSGVTDFEHAKALTKYALVTGQYLTKIVNFKTGTDGLRCMISDVIAIQHDVPQTGWGGKIKAVTQDGVYATITLSTPLDLAPASGELQVTLEKEGGMPVTLMATTPVPAEGITTLTIDCRYYAPGTTSPVLTYVPTVGTNYVLTLTTNALNRFKVLSIKRDADELCEITAVQYDPQIFDLADDTSDLGVFKPVDYTNLPNPTRSSVHGMDASVKVYQDSAGIIKTGIEVFYQVPTSSFWTGAIVYWGLAGSFHYDYLPVNTTGYAFIPDISVAGNYQVVVTSVYKTGKQTVADALADDMYRPYAFVEVTPFVINDAFLSGISGLEVVGSLDGSYYGKECKIQWRAPVAVDQYLNTAATATAPGNSTRSWLAYYQVEVKSTDGSMRRTAKVSTEYFSYSHEMNHADGRPVRTYDVSVIAVDRLGRSSKPVTLRATNPPPAAIQ